MQRSISRVFLDVLPIYNFAYVHCVTLKMMTIKMDLLTFFAKRFNYSQLYSPNYNLHSCLFCSVHYSSPRCDVSQYLCARLTHAENLLIWD